MINPKEMLESMVDRFAVTAQVQNVFGDAIESHGKTIIPVARVSYRLGAGGGGGADTDRRRSMAAAVAAESCRQCRWAWWK